MAVRIIVDSASDIEEDYARKHNLVVVPYTTTFEDGEFQEGVNITREQFYEKLVKFDTLPHTSQIPPADFYRVFSEIAEAGDTAVMIVLSSKLSGTCDTAVTLADEFDGKIRVVDSLNAALGEVVLIKRAVELRDEGASADEIAEILDREKHEVRLVALLDTLEYLRKGGRISKAVALAGGLLSIKPIVGVDEGEVAMLAKARGSKQGHKLLRKLVEKMGIDFSRPVRFGYSGLSDKALRTFLEESGELFAECRDKIDFSIIGSTIGTHIGPGAIGLAFFSSNPQPHQA